MYIYLPNEYVLIKSMQILLRIRSYIAQQGDIKQQNNILHNDTPSSHIHSSATHKRHNSIQAISFSGASSSGNIIRQQNETPWDHWN